MHLTFPPGIRPPDIQGASAQKGVHLPHRPYLGRIRFEPASPSLVIGKRFPFKTPSKGGRKEDEAEPSHRRICGRDGRTRAALRAPAARFSASCALQKASDDAWSCQEGKTRRSTDESVPVGPRSRQPQREHAARGWSCRSPSHAVARQERVEEG